MLAVGGLAYAKPHALGELVEGLTRASGAGATKHSGSGDGVPTPPEAPHADREVDARTGASRDRAAACANRSRSAAGAGRSRNSAEACRAARSRPESCVGRRDHSSTCSSGSFGLGGASRSELSQSDDQRTRDKADLGRAQLLLARGDLDQGCALARSLSNRNAGSHIERQAQLLLKSCAR